MSEPQIIDTEAIVTDEQGRPLPAIPKTRDEWAMYRSLEDIKNLATVMAESGSFKDTKQMAQAVAKMLAGKELGLGPVASLMGINVVEGKPELAANLIASIIDRHPGYAYRIIEHNDTKCVIEFYSGSKMVGQSTFTMEDAKKAELHNKLNWKKYPRNMLFARALSNGAKWFVPGAFGGIPVYYEGEISLEALPEETRTKSSPASAPAPPEPRHPGHEFLASMHFTKLQADNYKEACAKKNLDWKFVAESAKASGIIEHDMTAVKKYERLMQFVEAQLPADNEPAQGSLTTEKNTSNE